jgi:hypothetical protein
VYGKNRDWLAWSADGNVLATMWGGGVRLWDPTTGKLVHEFSGLEGRLRPPLAWSPDSKTWACAGREEVVCLWDLATDKKIRGVRGKYRSGGLEWSPHGKMLASFISDETVRVWEAATLKEICRFQGITYWTQLLAWSPDSKTLAWAVVDSPVFLWDVASGKEVGRFYCRDAPIRCMAWSPDGKKLATGGDDTTVLIWAFENRVKEASVPLKESELKSCWSDLAGEDAAQAYRAIATLTQVARQTVPFLAERLPMVKHPDTKVVSQLIRDLENDDFTIRQKADENLEQFGDVVEPFVRERLAGKPSEEVRKRLEGLLDKLEGWSGERLRVQRAITVLERIGNLRPGKFLEGLAKGAPGAQLTKEAKASLERLGKREAAEESTRGK